MPTNDCPDCNGIVSTLAPACPHCGRPMMVESNTSDDTDLQPDQGMRPPSRRAGEMYCPRCGNTSVPTTFTPGSTVVEFGLYLLGILPGILYGLWRVSGRKDKACAVCGADGMIPADSPKAPKAAIAMTPERADAEDSSDATVDGTGVLVLFVMAAAVVLAVLYLWTSDPDSTNSTDIRETERRLVELELDALDEEIARIRGIDSPADPARHAEVLAELQRMREERRAAFEALGRK